MGFNSGFKGLIVHGATPPFLLYAFMVCKVTVLPVTLQIRETY